VASDQLHVGRAYGKTSGFDLADLQKETYAVRVCGLGFTPYGTLYGGLVAALRQRRQALLACIRRRARSCGRCAWGERLFGCPVAIQDDVFLANGERQAVYDRPGLRRYPQGGGAIGRRAGLAGHRRQTAVLISEDGFLHCRSCSDLSEGLGRSALRSSPTLPGGGRGVVYLADQKGTAWAIEAASGKVRWQTSWATSSPRCPVVGPEHVIFGCRGGTQAVLGRGDGKVVWSRKIDSRF